jgi:hypothetical protein
VSAIFMHAARTYAECRDEFELVVMVAYDAAFEACRGRLLNPRGERLGVDDYTLFTGTEKRAYAYASEELVEWWADHPRPRLAQFEREWLAGRYR